MTALLIITLFGLFAIATVVASVWIEKNSREPVVRGYIE